MWGIFAQVKSWMQLLCGFFAFKSLVCLALSSFWRCVFSHCAFKISMLKSPVNVELWEYVQFVTKYPLGNLISYVVACPSLFANFQKLSGSTVWEVLQGIMG